VAEVETYRADQFDKVRWVELVVLEPGPTIEVRSTIHGGDLPSQETVSVEVSWQEPSPDAAANVAAFEEAAAGLTLADGLGLASESQPERYVGVGAVSAFTVTLAFEGRSRTYRANVAWKALSAELVLFSLGDTVVQSVVDLLAEDRPIVERDASEPRPSFEAIVPAEPDAIAEDRVAACEAARMEASLERLPCQERSPALFALDLHGRSEPFGLGAGAVALRRLEPSTATHQGQAVRSLTGEWALVEASPTSEAQVTSATVEDFGAGVVAGLSNTLAARLTASAGGKREALVVAVPLEEPPSRRIPLPIVRLEALPVQVPASQRGRTLLLADFGEDLALQKLTVLHGSAFVSHRLALHLERTLKLQAETATPHRVVAFVLVDVGAELEIVSQLRYRPRSCCGADFCQ
jgi:hypothetical protein